MKPIGILIIVAVTLAAAWYIFLRKSTLIISSTDGVQVLVNGKVVQPEMQNCNTQQAQCVYKVNKLKKGDTLTLVINNGGAQSPYGAYAGTVDKKSLPLGFGIVPLSPTSDLMKFIAGNWKQIPGNPTWMGLNPNGTATSPYTVTYTYEMLGLSWWSL